MTRFLVKLVVSVIGVLAAAASVHAATQHYTYQFVEGQDRLFGYGGGFLGTDVLANLTGSFDLAIEDDGTSIITRFDAHLMEILDQSDAPAGLADGDPLLPLLYVNPIGLAGEFDGNKVTIGSTAIVTAAPITQITLTPNSATTALFMILSFSGGFDTPLVGTEFPGILVRLVPEPPTAGLAIVMVGVALFAVRGRGTQTAITGRGFKRSTL